MGSNKRIHEKLLDSVANLKFLKDLSLQSCNLFGSLPSSIANLIQLESLYLSSNNFSGPIPFSFGNESSNFSFLYIYMIIHLRDFGVFLSTLELQLKLRSLENSPMFDRP